MPPVMPGAPPSGTVFEQILQELARMETAPEPKPPVMPLDDQRANVARNNDALKLGMLGQMSGMEGPQNIGSSIFKSAMARSEPKVTPQGTLDQLTGQFTPDPQVLQDRQDAKRGRLFQIASTAENARANREATDQRAVDQRAARQADIRLAASLRPPRVADDPEFKDAKRKKLEADTAAAEARAELAQHKVSQAQERAETQVKNAIEQGNIIIGKVDEALKDTGRFTTGIFGSAVGKVPGTQAYDLRKTVDTIKANIGFEQLQKMRMASPTGGALGQVAVKELDMLQAVVANLDANQRPQTVRKNLEQVKTHFTNWVNAMREHAQSARSTPPGTGVGSGSGAGAQPSPGASARSPAPGGGRPPPSGVDPAVWNVMTPEEKALWPTN